MADARFAFALPEGFGDLEAAPLLCAGLIGYRALRMTGDAPRLGLYGFGAAPTWSARSPCTRGGEVYAFTRAGDEARSLRAASWARTGPAARRAPAPRSSTRRSSSPRSASSCPAALRAMGRGGVVVCAGIHMSDIPSFPYELLWGERTLRSVANFTRDDAPSSSTSPRRVPVRTHVTTFALEDAEAALDAVRSGEIEGAAMLDPLEVALLETDRLGERHVDGGHRVGMDRPRAVTDVEEAAVGAPLCLVRMAA